jgi:hypothetical protein
MEIMQTLVHESCHHFQMQYGKPSKGNYHNREFSRIMRAIGLMTSSTGMPGGKTTGRQMADYPLDEGLFMKVFSEMPTEMLLSFKSNTPLIESTAINLNSKNKHKYSCPQCRINAWGKLGLNLICGTCQLQLSMADHNLTQ